MPLAHCVSSISGIILTVDDNFCRLMQRPEHELVGFSYQRITAPDDLEKSARLLHNLVDKAAPTRLRKRYLRPDGSLVATDLRTSRFDRDGTLVSSLFWIDTDMPRSSPERLWQAAIHIRDMFDLRIKELGADLFGDHAALILIHTYLAEAEGRVARIPAIAADAHLPHASASRWIKALDQRALINVLDDDKGLIQLSGTGAAKIEHMLESAINVMRA